MAGDHKCPVCQSTFTRPQHVARHMRSHTGDRPYKCQHCGDAFARSDLLSRHVNKCHSAEKAAAQAAALAAGLPPPGKGRKGRGSLSTKAPCDQCTLAKIPCNSGEPCTKCVQKNIKCTYNQMNIAKSQHLPSLTLTQTTTGMRPRASFDSTYSTSSSSSLDYPYGQVVPSVPLPQPAGTTSESVYSSLSNSLPPQFAFAPSLYSNLDSPQSAGFDTRSINSFSGGEYTPSPMSSQFPHKGSYANGVSGPELLPPNANPRSYRSALPDSMQPLADQQPFAFSTAELPQLNGSMPPNYHMINSDGRPHTSGEGFSSAFGLMSLDDPAVLAGYAEHAPFFEATGQSLLNQNRALPLPAHSSQAGWEHAVKDSERFRFNVPAAPEESFADVRAFWSSYMRTPSDKNIPRRDNDSYMSGNHTSSGVPTDRPSPPSRRVSRRASLPSSKTPPNYLDSYAMQTPVANKDFNTNPQSQALDNNRLPPVGNRPEELRAYEQAILARGTPQFKVDPSNIGPRRSRTLGHSHPANYASKPYDNSTDHTDRPMLPMGRNAPFIGPQGPGTEGSQGSSSHSSPVGGQNRLPSHQPSPHNGQQLRVPPPLPPTWDQQAVTGARRPKPKRNASQTLEQELQKSLKPSPTVDVTGDHESYGAGFGSTDEDYDGAKYSPALSASASLSGHSRPGTAHSSVSRDPRSSGLGMHHPDPQTQSAQQQSLPPVVYHNMHSSYTHHPHASVARRILPEQGFQNTVLPAYVGNA